MGSNSYWYLGLIFFSVFLLVYICYRKGTVLSLLLFIMMVQWAYFVETVIYIFGECYQYDPNFIKQSTYYDSNMGAIVSNAIVVPTLATFIATFKLKRGWMAIFTAFLAVVEISFIKLNIYTLYWWRVEYTSLGLFLIFFPLAKGMYQLILKSRKGLIHSGLLFFSVAPILANFYLVPTMLFETRHYLTGWFENPDHNTTAFASIYYVCVSILLVILVKLSWKRKWFKYVIMAIIVLAINTTLEEMKILYVYQRWDPWYYIISSWIVLKIGGAISKQLSRGA